MSENECGDEVELTAARLNSTVIWRHLTVCHCES